MADGTTNRDLSHETAEVLLNAIKQAAPQNNARGIEGLESLAKAYAAVVEAMPKASSGRGRGVLTSSD